jgi:formylglycine-generating enzyme required for sulfatase activity
MGHNPSSFKEDKFWAGFRGKMAPYNPVEMVSWNDCRAFIDKINELSAKQGSRMRFALPTEAQWEFACRAGTIGAYCRKADLDEIGWYKDNSGGKTHSVAAKKPNAWGLYDMHGNVWEWCEDLYGDYPSGIVTDPTGDSSGSDRVLRGGSWVSAARACRSAYRGRGIPGSLDAKGLRLVLTIDQ